MIRIGIVGCNYGRLIHLPAFRLDPRCEVIALAGTDSARTAELARAANIPLSFGNWTDLVEHPDVDAITIATPPALQQAIALRALKLGKPVFAEKPMAADLHGAAAMLRAAKDSGRATMVDFNFSANPGWRKAKSLLDQGAIGRLRHVAVNWNVENHATRMRLKIGRRMAKTAAARSATSSATVSIISNGSAARSPGCRRGCRACPTRRPWRPMPASAWRFASGASGSLAMSCASYLGSGHRIEFYGEDGSLTLVNATPDYMRGFELRLASGRRRRSARSRVEDDHRSALSVGWPDCAGIPPRGRFPRCHRARQHRPSLALREGFRVQELLDAARRANERGRWLDIEPEIGRSGDRELHSGHRRQRFHRTRRWSRRWSSDGHAVRVLDDNSRGAPRRLEEVEGDIEFIGGDIRDAGRGDAGRARHRRGPPPRFRQRHRILL